MPNNLFPAFEGAIAKFVSGEWTLVNGGGDGYIGPSPADSFPIDDDASPAVVGILTTYSRGDHKHKVKTDVPISVGTVNQEGVANTLSRSDHQHEVSSLNIVNQAVGDVLYFDGTNWIAKIINEALPVAQVGQFLYCADSDVPTFNPEWPLVNDDGFIITNDDDYIVVK